MILPEILKFILYTFVALINLFADTVQSDRNTEWNEKIIATKNGKIRGVQQTTLFNNIDYYSFKGIPYAKPPTGELRFKAPEPIDESWAPIILDATEFGPVCIQTIEENTYTESEDCLLLNVYVPADVEPDEKLPILIYIHGGSFAVSSGSDEAYGPDFLIEQNVILVTINYRLGFFGFLSLGTPEYSGNMGLKDQQLALKWVHTNIEYFSGDNQRITLFGHSAGGASTHFHMLSEESRKYFRNAIPMSGSVENMWALYEKSDHLNLAYKIAENYGEPKHTFNELVEFLKTVPASKISKNASSSISMRTGKLEIAPVIESEFESIRPFIVFEPSDIYNKTKIDVNAMFTLCSAEFLSFYSEKSGEIYNLKGLDRNFSLTFPFRNFNLPFDSPEYDKFSREIRELYFKNATIDENSLQQYLEMLSDINLAYGIEKSARRHAIKSTSKTYFLRFSVDSKLNVLKQNSIAKNLPGAAHLDDLCYLFRCGSGQRIYEEILENKSDEQSKISLRVIENLTKIIANFAKYGEPTHKGDPVDKFLPIQENHVHFLDFTNDGLEPGVNPNQKAYRLWSRIEQHIKSTK